MHIILGILGGLLGLYFSGEGGVIVWIAIGVLIAEVLSQRKRIAALEEGFRSKPAAATDEVVFAPVADDEGLESAAPAPAAIRPVARPSATGPGVAMPAGPPPAAAAAAPSSRTGGPPETSLDRFFAGIGDGAGKLVALLTGFFTGGNLVLKIGIIILFFGVAFLLKYAAQRDLVPLEFRLIGVALGGLALLATGWQLRRRILGYGLILQGGGIGILYLVVYAAAKLYHFLPLPLSLAVMVALVLLSSILAVLQEAKSLAVAGIVGGFLAPVLMSTGAGSHVLLFSYYGLLNIGILMVAWFKSWRELNLLGFFFTFAIATVWGATAYQPENFATTEPFLIFFFLLYIAVSVLFAHRQPLDLKGFIDGPLVFGLPLVVSSLQYCLVRDYEYGMAISALALGLFYSLLATLLWRRLAEGMRMLTEAFLALAVVFGSLAIPLALDGQWSSATWAMEGAAMIWVGVRQDRPLARLFALLLQVGAALLFLLDGGGYPFGAPAFLNRFFFGCLFIALAGLFSSYYLDRFRDRLRAWERFLPLPLLVWGLLWWYFGGLREADRHYPADEFVNIVLLFGSASTMLMTMVARRIAWRQLLLAQGLFLPAMVVLVPPGLLGLGFNSHLLFGWGLFSWPIALFTAYRLLNLAEDQWPRRLTGIWHPLGLWLVLFLLNHETAWLARRIIGFAEVWSAIGWGLPAAAAIFLLSRFGAGLCWPFGKHIEVYRGIGCIGAGIWLILWNFYCLGLTGDPEPIAYLPFFNPLELSQAATLTVLFFWAFEAGRQGWKLPAFCRLPAVYGLLAGIAFLVLNSTVARTVHVFAGVPFTAEDLYHSLVFQAALAALWGLLALAITVWSAKKGNRRIWCVGAALLALVVVKLFVVDLSGTGTVARIVSFLVVGGLMLIIGYFSPLPPAKKEEQR